MPNLVSDIDLDTNFIWTLKIRLLDDPDIEWDLIPEEPKVAYSTLNQMTNRTFRLLKKYPKIKEIKLVSEEGKTFLIKRKEDGEIYIIQE